MKLSLILLFAPAALALTHTETINKTFAAPHVLDVDNISGSVHVTAYSGNQVELTAVRTDEADTQDALAQAAREVSLKTEEKNGELMIYVDGPFRDRNPPFRGFHSDYHNPPYKFHFDFTLRVPQSLDLNVRNVNHGGIAIEGVHGHFSVQEVNGRVDMKDVAGEGQVHSVNGPLHVEFSQNPTGPWKFRTVNGEIEARLLPSLSADLEYKTMHGGIYTDFELTGAPVRPAGQTDSRNGRFVYRSRGMSNGRVGSGGPLLSFETVNGEIRILKK